jgi:hypothetical protein
MERIDDKQAFPHRNDTQIPSSSKTQVAPILILMSDVDLLAPLHQYWGYSSFRPMQERIVRGLVGGHDTCVIMPTGGGKSLCYQLPALALGKTTIVISPLIALMHDQVAQLTQMGIPAAVLNSSLSQSEQSQVMKKARAGAFRLLYVSPERLAGENTIGWMRGLPISSPLMKPTASPSGDTNSVPNTGSSGACGRIFPRPTSRRSPPAQPNASVTTSCTSFNCAIRISTSPASAALTCATRSGNARPGRCSHCCSHC